MIAVKRVENEALVFDAHIAFVTSVTIVQPTLMVMLN